MRMERNELILARKVIEKSIERKNGGHTLKELAFAVPEE